MRSITLCLKRPLQGWGFKEKGKKAKTEKTQNQPNTRQSGYGRANVVSRNDNNIRWLLCQSKIVFIMQRLYDGVKCFEWIIFFYVSLYRNHYFIRVRINIHMTKTGKGVFFNWYFMFSSFIIFISKIWIGCWNQQSSSFIHLSMIPMVAKLICHF